MELLHEHLWPRRAFTDRLEDSPQAPEAVPLYQVGHHAVRLLVRQANLLLPQPHRKLLVQRFPGDHTVLLNRAAEEDNGQLQLRAPLVLRQPLVEPDGAAPLREVAHQRMGVLVVEDLLHLGLVEPFARQRNADLAVELPRHPVWRLLP